MMSFLQMNLPKPFKNIVKKMMEVEKSFWIKGNNNKLDSKTQSKISDLTGGKTIIRILNERTNLNTDCGLDKSTLTI